MGRRLCMLAMAWLSATACGEDPTNRLPDAPPPGDGGDHGNGDGGPDDGGPDAPAAPAMGCVPAEIEAECAMTIAVTAPNTPDAPGFTMTRTSMNATVWFQFQNTNQGQPGVVYPYSRVYAFNCVEQADGRRAWNATYRDSCYSLNSIGNFRPDWASGNFETREGRCPSGRYLVTARDDYNGDAGTCTNLAQDAELIAP